ncbi:MAG: YigZ family protein [Bacteroidota bacterium]
MMEMPPGDSFKTIKSLSSGSFKDKGSRFIAEAWPVRDQDQIDSILEETRKTYHDAKHHSYAYLLGMEGLIWRANDDGEPSGTAGRPILGQIRSFGVTNVLIVVTRYFGGTLLGVSGLINAYKKAAASALEKAEIIDHVIHEFYEINYPYAAMKSVMKIIREEDIKQSEHSFDLECRIIISFRALARERIINRISRIEGLTYRLLSSA